MRFKNLFLLFLCSVFLSVSTSCAMSTGIDTMLEPPKLGKKHREIYDALMGSVSGKIRLKYPKDGKYLSAFTVADIDGDNQDEAIVFYEPSNLASDDTSLRMNILDESSGVWTSVYDYSCAGIEVEKIIISHIGESKTPRVAVGYSTVNENEKLIEVYHYEDNSLKTGEFSVSLSETQSFFDVADVDGDELTELIIITSKTAEKPAILRCLKYKSDSVYYESDLTLNENSVSPVNVKYEKSDSENRVYIDENIGGGMLQTEIFTVSEGFVSGVFMNEPSVFDAPNNTAFELMRAEVEKTVRPTGYYSSDIDGDGMIEIPTNVQFPGHDDTTAQIPMTNWLKYDGGTLFRYYESYYNVSEKYVVMFPAELQGKITVLRDVINNDIVFYHFETDLEHSKREIFRLTAADFTQSSDKLRKGYKTVRTSGQSFQMVRVADDAYSFEEIYLWFYFV